MKNISSLCWIHWKFASRLPLCHHTLLEFSDHYLQEKMLNSLPTMIFHSSFKPFLLYILPILPHLYWLKDCQGYNWWSCCQWCEWKSTNSSNYSANVLYHFSMFQVSRLLIAEKNSITMAVTRRTLAHFLKKKSLHIHRHSFIGSFIKNNDNNKFLTSPWQNSRKGCKAHPRSFSFLSSSNSTTILCRYG